MEGDDIMSFGELLIDWDGLEDELSVIDDPNKKTKWNEAVWRTIGILAAILLIQYATTTIHYTGGGTGWLGTGWSFDYNTFILLCIGSVSSLLIIGLKLEAGQKKMMSKIKILRQAKTDVDSLKREISEKQDEISQLRKALGDKCSTLEANAAALKTAEVHENVQV